VGDWGVGLSKPQNMKKMFLKEGRRRIIGSKTGDEFARSDGD
jgi:hypothetical protein